MNQLSILHSIAIVCCLTTILCSIAIIFHSLYGKKIGVFFRRSPLICRLQVYTAMGDILFTSMHGSDHIYLIVTGKAMQETSCKIMGWIFVVSFNCMGCIACIVTLSAFIVVVLEKKLFFWKFDAIMWSVALLIPITMAILAVCLDWLGFNGLWCGILPDVANSAIIVPIYTGMMMALNFFLSIFTYSSVLIKIIRSSWRIDSNAGTVDTRGLSAETKKMSIRFFIFVLLQFIQWLPLCLYVVVTCVGHQPSFALMVSLVFFSNTGGIYNGIVYVAFRRKIFQHACPATV